MKIWLIDQNEIICGSANISEKALVHSSSMNLEFLNPIQPAAKHDLQKLNEVLENSTKVTEQDYLKVKDLSPIQVVDLEAEDLNDEDREISLNSLPKSKSVKQLWENYLSGLGDSETMHDIQLFELPEGLTEKAFLEILKKEVLQIPLVLELTEILRKEKMYWGEVKRWLKFALPKEELDLFELDTVIDILYNWLPVLRKKYFIEQPNHSEQINYNSNMQSTNMKVTGERIKQQSHRRKV
jgi:hypothetical protein